MLFNSPAFLFAFLPAIALLCITLQRCGKVHLVPAALLLGSLFFYGYWEPKYLLVIVFSILANYAIGLQIIDAKQSSRPTRQLLAAGVILNLLPLFYFKYASFALSLIPATNTFAQTLSVALPIGISFYTFQQIAYLVDCHRGQVTSRGFLDYALFVSFFPQLIAGPIVHHSEVLPQIKALGRGKLLQATTIEGLTIFILGLSKKVLIADRFGYWASSGFANPSDLSTLEAWSASLCYYFQIYFDFSGYSDMAIGLGLIFGIKLPLNFNAPYRATSIIDFWRRWHITLSTFLRDYLYIPLGGNRGGELFRYRNLIITMLLGGLWHGAGWTFIIWGAIHGGLLAANHLVRSISGTSRKASPNRSPAKTAFCWIATQLAILIAWVFFRAANAADASHIIAKMFSFDSFILPTGTEGLLSRIPLIGQHLLNSFEFARLSYLASGSLTQLAEQTFLLAIAFALILSPKHLHQLSQRKRLLLLALCFAFCLQNVTVGGNPSEFLYFQF